MTTISTLLGFILFIALIAGLIKPENVISWSKKPTRLKVFGYWILTMFILIQIDSATSSKSPQINPQLIIDSAQVQVYEGRYESAIKGLKSISKDEILFDTAQILLNKADSINNLSDEQKRLLVATNLKKRIEDEKLKAIKELRNKIERINKGINIPHRGTSKAITDEFKLFRSWTAVIYKNRDSVDPEIQKLTKEMKSKVIKLQSKEFPNLRQDYALNIGADLWDKDISVTTSGARNTTITFTGGIFAANKNKSDFYHNIEDSFIQFRFKKVYFRWYEGAEDGTSFTVPSPDDTYYIF